MMPHSDPTPSNPFDVARERWLTYRVVLSVALLTFSVFLMSRCTERWKQTDAMIEFMRQPDSVEAHP